MNQYELEQVIRSWVTDNFGQSETDDPSWNIEALSEHVAKHFDNKTKHNGWSNYATWRINLEILDAEADSIRDAGDKFDSVRELDDHLRQMVDDYFELNLAELDPDAESYALSMMHSYSDAFIADVNFYEIAQNMAADNPEFVKESK